MIESAGRLGVVLAVFLLSGPAGASAIKAGRQVAEGKCVACHAIGEADASANPKAPPFRSLHTRYPIDGLRPAFLEGLQVGHRDMPKFLLTPQDITDLLLYLRSLDPCGRPSSDKAAMQQCFAPMKE